MKHIIQVLNQNPILYLVIIVLSIIILFAAGKMLGSIVAQIIFYIKN